MSHRQAAAEPASEESPSASARLGWMVRHARKLILALVLLMVGVAVAAYSFGAFTSSAANPKNVVSSGTMTQVSSKPNEAILGAKGMVPGDPATVGSVTIQNAGDAEGRFVLSSKDLASPAGPRGGRLSEVLRLEIRETPPSGTTRTVFTGLLGDFKSVDLAGVWQPNQTRTYEFRVTFPHGPNDNRYQGATLTVTYVWDATQSN